ncbi:SDR family NAD(P)-dependent oxidoreductase [Rugamonas sp. FT82W]|uniref:SDR family NAD(P)-dependent oxidoreductase n=1 Tax=Duganella vulcania TaxID=2692166 RepID=A0A845G163_9BURK|nr:SDR family NAD(P)-dependent oxidoreductase [Duganella vulcania]MYM86767.1 SDR family NAD(P)-dependent oxidoreductase [Duganella vulcania]
MGNCTDAFLGDKVIIVAGGGSGLGRRYCLDMAAAGAKVIVAGRSNNVMDVVAEAAAAGGVALPCQADVRDGERPVELALKTFGRIDGLIVNAGHVKDRSFAKMTADEWTDVLSVHLGGTYASVKAVWPHMLAQGAGRIVLTTSGAGAYGNFGQANYAAAKGAIISLARTLALEGASKNVFVNAVAPMALTGMTDGVFSERQKERLKPELVSAYVLALLHSQSRENGSVIEVGGGWAAKLRWQRARGLRLAPESITPELVLSRWEDIQEFGPDATYPSTTADCLAAAVGDS